MSHQHPGMLQDGTAWTKQPRGARTCPAPVQYLAPRCGGGRRVSRPPGRQNGAEDSPDSIQCLQELPRVWGQGQPSPAIEPGWVCPAGHWGGPVPASPGDVGFPATAGNLRLQAGGFLLNYFRPQKIYICVRV